MMAAMSTGTGLALAYAASGASLLINIANWWMRHRGRRHP